MQGVPRHTQYLVLDLVKIQKKTWTLVIVCTPNVQWLPPALVSTWTEPIIDVLGSGGNCGDTAGNKYCGQTLNVAKEQTASIPICDCSAPFFVGIVTDNVRDENSDKTANRGDTI